MFDSRRRGSAFEFIPGTTACHQIWLPKTHLIFKIIIMVLLLSPKLSLSATSVFYYNAFLDITYTQKTSNETVSFRIEGRFGYTLKSARLKVGAASGVVVHVKTVSGKQHGCDDYSVTIPQVKWIALIARGECKFSKKISNAMRYNASAVVVYDMKNVKTPLHIMKHDVEGIVAISIPYSEGKRIADLLDKGFNLTMQITVGAKAIKTVNTFSYTNKKNPALPVMIYFVGLIIPLALCAVFCFIGWFDYARMKERSRPAVTQ
ncbi:RING finger protein 150-like [Haliotis rufescens]|uniref:RING finger protein 150-like n=1 Tax=Haliotis rufescens TaxID=6454 RepID=UPI00201F91EC|nr:RING finger protein 150-like [Haliotis rufescens]